MSTLAKSELLAGTLPPGTRLRNYQLVSHLATGGMAELYLARAVGIQNFERLVVVKRILPQWARDPQFVAMFLDEARLAAQLSHPNIAQVFDIGEESGTYFFTMEFIHGEDLRTVLRRNHKEGKRLPLELAVSTVIETASALHHAHEATDTFGNSLELVHRDVSPSNVLLSYEGAVKVVDFGIAKAANRQQETRTGCLKGKIAYMAPEQCLGEDLDRRADVFALGILLYETTTGRKCFDGRSDFKTLEMITTGGFKPPSAHVANYPDELESIVRRALAVDREIRYQTAESFASHLEMFAAKNGLPLSRRHRGRYMRERFADKLEEWESAQREGKSLAAHLSEASRMYSLTPSGIAPMSQLTPSGVIPASLAGSNPPLFDSNVPVFSESNIPAPADSNPAVPETSPSVVTVRPRHRFKMVAAILLAMAATAAFVLVVMPKLGLAPWTTSAGSSPQSGETREAPQPAAGEIEDAARAQAEAEARAVAAEKRADKETKARVEAESVAKDMRRDAEAADADAADAETVADAETPEVAGAEETAKEKRRARRKRKRESRKSSTSSKPDKTWEANSPLLPSRSKNKK